MNILKNLSSLDINYDFINKYDAIIVGSGFSGSIVARFLADKNKKILIIEKRKHVAGNMFDYYQDQILTHKYGPHILYFDSDVVYKFLIKYSNLVEYHHKVYANVDGELLPLPINFKSLKTIFKNEYNTVIDLLLKTFKSKSITIYDLLENNETKYIGKVLYEKIFYHYSKKMWGIDPSNLDTFVMSRIPIKFTDDDNHFSNKYQFMPSEGYTKLFNNILSNENIDILLDTDFNKIFKIRNSKIFIGNDNITKNIIYTGSIDELFNFNEGILEYRSLNLVIEKVDGFYQQYPVINYPDDRNYTRITDMKKLNCQNENFNWTITIKEYPGNFEIHSKLFYDRYYPIPCESTRKTYQKYINKSNKINNLYLLGRLAQYQYINMEKTILNALSFCSLIKNIN